MRTADRRTAVFVAGVGSLARHHAGYPLNPIDILARDTTADGRRELRALRKDPVLDFRAPAPGCAGRPMSLPGGTGRTRASRHRSAGCSP